MVGLGKEIDQTTRETKELNTQWNSFGHALKQGVGLGIATAVMKGLIRTLRQAPRAVLGLVKDYGSKQQAELGLAAAIRAHGGAAEALLPSYKQLVSAIQAVTSVGDEQTLAMMATATQMGINSEQMEQTIKGAIGLSKAFGLDLSKAARASAAAVQGNTNLHTRYIPALANVQSRFILTRVGKAHSKTLLLNLQDLQDLR